MSFILIVQLPNLMNFFSRWGAQQRVRPVEGTRGRRWRSWNARLNRAKIDVRRSSCVDSRKSWKSTGLPAGGRPHRGEKLGADGSAREHGPADRMAAAGRHVRGGGPGHAVDPGAVGNDADRDSQPLAGVSHDGRTVSGAVLKPERPAGGRGRVAVAADREAGRPAAGGAASRRVGTGFGHRAGGLALAHAVARGEDDAVDAR